MRKRHPTIHNISTTKPTFRIRDLNLPKFRGWSRFNFNPRPLVRSMFQYINVYPIVLPLTDELWSSF